MRKRKIQEADVPGERKPMKRCQADAATGLSQEQVQEYIDNGWRNNPVEAPSKTVGGDYQK